MIQRYNDTIMDFMMDVQINLLSRVPIYVQVVDQIKHKIATGDLKPGDQLPTVRQLAAKLRVNFNTIARAYRLLDDEGVISTQQGRGTYILGFQIDGNGKKLREQDLNRLTIHYLIEAYRLGFGPDDVKGVILQALARWELMGEPGSDGDT